jgi:uncharacterized FlgJ-related protein
LSNNIQRIKVESIGIESPRGILASIAAAECIIKSEWGALEVAKKENNLFLLEKEPNTKGKGFEFNSKIYKIYDNWLEFSTDLSDYYVFSNLYNDVLLARNLDQQLDLLVNVKDYSNEYCVTIEALIEKYGLWEFDLYF